MERIRRKCAMLGLLDRAAKLTTSPKAKKTEKGAGRQGLLALWWKSSKFNAAWPNKISTCRRSSGSNFASAFTSVNADAKFDPLDLRHEFRIGIHVGDIIIEDRRRHAYMAFHHPAQRGGQSLKGGGEAWSRGSFGRCRRVRCCRAVDTGGRAAA